MVGRRQEAVSEGRLSMCLTESLLSWKCTVLADGIFVASGKHAERKTACESDSRKRWKSG